MQRKDTKLDFSVLKNTTLGTEIITRNQVFCVVTQNPFAQLKIKKFLLRATQRSEYPTRGSMT